MNEHAAGPRDQPQAHSGRIPPHATEAEQACLGAALLDRQAIWTLQEHLTPEDFFTGRHSKIYEAICRLSEADTSVDLVTVADELRSMKALEQTGGQYYLAELMGSVGSANNAEHYALIVREKSMLRQLIQSGTQVASEAYDPAADVFEVLDAAERSVLAIRGEESSGRHTLGSLLRDHLVTLEQVQNSDRKVTGITSGLDSIDEITTGWQDKSFILLAARPSMGKTAFGIQMAKRAAAEGIPTCFFSIEMGAEEVAHRLLCGHARVDSHRARSGKLKDDDWINLARAAGRLNDLPLYIDDTASLTDTQLRGRVRRMHHDHGVRFVIVDYLQLMQATGLRRSANREQEISTISRSIKSLAKELAIPVMALSQLSRAVETRGGDKRPMLSDLRESGSLEQDADVVMFLYRPEYYGITVDDNGNSTDGTCEVIFGKQRNGPTGTRSLRWMKDFGTFEMPARQFRLDSEPAQSYYEPREDDAPF